jgi:uncharacterized protein YecA (UPF0149 family)
MDDSNIVLEQKDPELAGYFTDIVNKKLPALVVNDRVFKRMSGGGLCETIISESTVGRNDKCPCGSGKKFKHCCLKG